MAASEKRKAYLREWMKKYRHSVKGRRYYKRYYKAYRSTPERQLTEQKREIKRARNPKRIAYLHASAHVSKVRQCARNWSRSERGRSIKREIKHRRRCRITDSGGSWTTTQFTALCRQYNWLCLACGQRRKLTIDHVIPVCKGGCNDTSNIQPLCGLCNSKKGTRTIDYRPHIHFLN